MVIGGIGYEFHERDIFIINPGEPHSISSSAYGPHSYTVLIFPDELIQYISTDIYGDGSFLLFHNRISGSVEASERFHMLTAVINDPDSLLESSSAFYSFIEFLARCHSMRGLPREQATLTGCVETVRKFIDENCTEQITLEDLSSKAGVSPFHLNRVFTSETGMPPHSYQVHRRIENSKRLLLEGFSIAHVAAETGFSDQSHFTKFFKRITGTTPGRFLLHNR